MSSPRILRGIGVSPGLALAPAVVLEWRFPEVPDRSVRPEDIALRDAHSLLTARELSVVRLLAEGRTNEDIGGELFISSATVKTHLSNAYEKLGARNRYDAVVKATQRGIL